MLIKHIIVKYQRKNTNVNNDNNSKNNGKKTIMVKAK